MDNTNNKLNGYRRWAIDHDENVSWCKPYVSDDGRVMYTLTEGVITDLVVDGVSIDTVHDSDGSHVADADVDKIARRYNPYYDDDETPVYNLITCSAFRDAPCAVCPYFRECENWDNPDGWDDFHPDYPDDPGYDD